MGNMHITKPLSYLDFLSLEESAKLVISDSGGIQQECSALGVPLLTLRDTTERPDTVARGTNRLLIRVDRMVKVADEILETTFEHQIFKGDQSYKRASTLILSCLRTELYREGS